jgi:DHA1 family tetracycline resistance protein-like MFS transporter
MDTKRLLPIVLIIFTNILGAGVILPILPLYAEDQFGGTVPQVTLLSSSFFAAQFIAAPLLGRLSDRVGRRPVLLISQAGTVLAFILFIFAAPLGRAIESPGVALPVSGGMLVLFAARILDGLTGGNITTAQAYVADVTPPEERPHALGLLQAGFGMGFIFGPAFGGVLSTLGPVMPFVGAAAITTLTLLLTAAVLKESLPPEARLSRAERRRVAVPMRALLSDGALVTILLIAFFGTLAFAALQSTYALYANAVIYAGTAFPERINLYIGLMLTFLGFVAVITQLWLLRPLVRRFGERRLVLIGQLAIALALFGTALAAGPAAATLLLAPLAFGQGISEPNLQSLVTRFGSERTRGQLLGVYQSSRSLALILGPAWAGYVFAAIRPQATYRVASAIVLIAVLFAALLLRQVVPVREVRLAEAPTSGAD